MKIKPSEDIKGPCAKIENFYGFFSQFLAFSVKGFIYSQTPEFVLEVQKY